jgi:hypothetical protein
MNAHAAHLSDTAKLLLAAYEEIKKGPAHPEDVLEATRLAGLPLAPVAIISRMQAIKHRNGPEWRPSRMRYFANAINDILKEPPQSQPQPTQPAVLPPLTEEEHEQSLAALQALETPEQRRRVELVGTLEPRATFPSWCDSYTIGSMRWSSPGGFNRQGSGESRRRPPSTPPASMQPNRRLEGFHPGVRNCSFISAL